MRPKERIPVFLSLVDWETLSERWGIDVDMFNAVLTLEGKLRPTIVNYWLRYPNFTIGQILINLEIVPDLAQIWVDEEENILEDQGIEKETFYKEIKKAQI
jgi:hypothetical protein